MSRGVVLVVDDEPDVAEATRALLQQRGFTASTELDATRALVQIDQGSFDAVLVDVQMEPVDGLALCVRLKDTHPNLPVIVVTGRVTVDAAIGAMRAGAFDFITKPVDVDLLEVTVERALSHHRMRSEIHRLRNEVNEARGLGKLLGSSASMRRVSETIARVAPTHATVLVTGESGTGKELVARAIHDASMRRSGPFVAINCAAVPAPLLESELFGHARGAFTDAKTSRKGLFLEAQGGTLFLDEIGEMPLEMQVKLLRALQEHTVRAVGGSNEVPFDARIIAATNVDLEHEVHERRFREDLYYRINVCTVEVPPLREREGDVALLTKVFVERLSQKHGKAVRDVSSAALAKLTSYPWPGNVRELENSIERAVAMTQFDQVAVADLPPRVQTYEPTSESAFLPQTASELVTVDELERRYILHVLALMNGNKARTARILGYDRRTLYRKIVRFAARGHGKTADAPEAPSLVGSDRPGGAAVGG